MRFFLFTPFALCLLCFIFVAAPDLHAQPRRVHAIVLVGNKQTHQSVILREMTIKEGGEYLDEQLHERMLASRENILNTSLFNYVYVSAEALTGDTTSVTVTVQMEERWYIWPTLDFILEDRNTSAWIKDPSWSKVTVMGGLTIYNMRGRDETLGLSGKWGYRHAASLSYQGIALDSRKRHLFGASYSYETQYDIAYMTVGNEVLYAESNDGPMKTNNMGSVNYTYRPRMRDYHNLRFDFNNVRIKDTLLQLNPNYWGSERTERNFLRLIYFYRSDYRDSYTYPLQGYLFGLTTDGNMALDGDSYALVLYPEYQYHKRLASRWGYAVNTAAKISLISSDAYLNDLSLGYRNKWMRGYEYYVMDGQYYALLQNNIKFTLMPTKLVTINFLSALSKFNKIHFTFYLNAFFDAGYVHNRYAMLGNTLQNTFLYSGGLGLDLATYYDITLRVDYSVNKMGKGGFYFHLTAPFI